MMAHARGVGISLAVAIVTVIATFGGSAWSQSNPYRAAKDGWLQFPREGGRTIGGVVSVDFDSKGNLWIFERCGVNTLSSCAYSNLPPILEFDPSGKFLRSFGGGMFVVPHAFYVDKDDNVWAGDGRGPEVVKGTPLDRPKGHQIFKFSPEGKVLLTLGKAGVAGDGPDTFDSPSDVVTAPNGEIFVADGHGGNTNARIVKFSKDGKFIKAWGKKGSAPGEFNVPHTLAMDSKGRLFVGDRVNNRIQIFDQDGKFLEEWRQFGRPSGIFIDKKDILYVTDDEGTPQNNPGFETGIRIGNVKDGVVTAFIPAAAAEDKPLTGTHGVAADAMGNVYGAETTTMNVRKYVKK